VDISCVENYWYIFVSRSCFICTFSRCCKTISAIVLEIGEPIETIDIMVSYIILSVGDLSLDLILQDLQLGL